MIDPDPVSGWDPPSPQDVASFVESELFARRVIIVSSRLDASLAGRVAAALMTLDASGDDHVEVRLDSAEGSLDAAFTLIDTIDLLGVPVHITCTGTAGGGAVGVLAAGARRRITPHGRVHLFAPAVRAEGNAAEMALAADHHREQLRRFQQRLASASRQPFEHIETDMDRGRFLDAQEALAYGLVDEIAQRPRHDARRQDPRRRDPPR